MKRAIIIILCLLSIGFLIVGCTGEKSKATAKATTKVTNQGNNKAQDAGQKSDTENKSQSKDHGKAKKKAMRYPGVVQKVDLKAKTMIVGKEDRNLSYLFDITKVILNGYKDIKELKVGDKVTVDYDVISGKVVAKIITKK